MSAGIKCGSFVPRWKRATAAGILAVGVVLLAVTGNARAADNFDLGEVHPGNKNLGPRPGPPRYLDDYSALANTDRVAFLDKIHYLPLSKGAYLSLGGGYKGIYTNQRNMFFGVNPTPQGPLSHMSFYSHRAEVHADLHLFDNTVRVFGEVSDTLSAGRQKGGKFPVFESDFELHQLFADVNFHVGTAARGFVRMGRQEMKFGSGVLFRVREGFPVREVYDGIRGTVRLGQRVTLNAFAVQDVANHYGSFNDSSAGTGRFAGIYGTVAWMPKTFSQDLYVLYYRRNGRRAFGVHGNDERYTMGTRAFGNAGPLFYSNEAMFQTSHFGHDNIRAWATANTIGVNLPRWMWRSSVGLQADVGSGDGNKGDHTTETFDPLFPSDGLRYGFGLYGHLSNLISVGPKASITAVEPVTVSVSVLGNWKETRTDAVYVGGLGAPLPGSANTHSSYIGTSYIMFVRWAAAKYLTFDAAYQYMHAGGAIHEAHGSDGQFVAIYGAFYF